MGAIPKSVAQCTQFDNVPRFQSEPKNHEGHWGRLVFEAGSPRTIGYMQRAIYGVLVVISHVHSAFKFSSLDC